MYDGDAYTKFHLFLIGHGDSEVKLLDQLKGKDEYTFNIDGITPFPNRDKFVAYYNLKT